MGPVYVTGLFVENTIRFQHGMAKKSSVVKNERRKKIVARYSKVRLELKEKIRSSKTSEEDREAARIQFHKLPRNASPSRVRNRCVITGRARSVYSKFGLCRHKLREYAHKGELPGVIKSSW